MDNFFVFIFFGCIFKAYTSTIAIDQMPIIIHVVNSISLGSRTISVTDVTVKPGLLTDFQRREWCAIVNNQLDRKLGRNRFLDETPPGRDWTYKIDVEGKPKYVRGFVCAGDPKCFLVAVERFTPTLTDVQFHGYTLPTNSTIVTNVDKTESWYRNVYTLRAI